MNFDAEEDGRIKFEINDWDLNHEFSSNRRPKKTSKESHIYGNFMSSDEEEEENPMKNKDFLKDLYKEKQKANPIISFQKGSDSTTPEEDSAQTSASNSSNRYSTFTSGSNRKYNHSNTHFAGVSDQNFGRYGMGAKLAKMMGWKPGTGLGKDGQGIIDPIEANQRPVKGGLGIYESDYKQMNTEEEIEENIKIQQKLRAETNWKQTEHKTKRSKIVIKSANQIIAENLLRPWNESEANKVKVIDMTGPEQRVLEGYHQINQSIDETLDYNNIDVLRDMTEDEINENTKELKRESFRYNGLEEEIQRLREVIEDEKKNCNNIEMIFEKISHLSKKMNEKELSINEILDAYDELRSEYMFEFESFKLHEILIPTAFPLIRLILQEWNPFENSDSIKQLFQKLKRITLRNDEAIYETIMWEIWMPIVRRHICEWPSIRQCDEVIAFLESWRPLMPDWLFDNIIEQIILPLMQKEVEDWNPLTDTVPIHSWLHPWLPLMVDRSLDHLYDMIRHKLSNALTNWHPSDGSAKLILEPWKGVFSAGSMEAFLNINIVPKLEIALQSLIINPHQQCLDVWHWVMSWQDLIPTTTLATILEKNFFPKWLNVLHNWLSNSPNFDEVFKWYSGWKSLLSSQLEAHPSIRDPFARALQMLNYSSTSNGAMKPFQAFYPPIRPQQQMSSNNFVPKEDSNSDNALNFRQLIERKAEERGILFMPIPHRFHEGKPIFKFGKQTVHIDRRVIFTFNNNNWIPISLQSLIDSESVV